jgi:hypothetical protein
MLRACVRRVRNGQVAAGASVPLRRAAGGSGRGYWLDNDSAGHRIERNARELVASVCEEAGPVEVGSRGRMSLSDGAGAVPLKSGGSAPAPADLRAVTVVGGLSSTR